MALYSDGDLSALRLGVRFRAIVERARYYRVDRPGRRGTSSGHSTSGGHQRFGGTAGDSCALPDTIGTGDHSGNPRSLWMATRMDRIPGHRVGENWQAHTWKIPARDSGSGVVLTTGGRDWTPAGARCAAEANRGRRASALRGVHAALATSRRAGPTRWAGRDGGGRTATIWYCASAGRLGPRLPSSQSKGVRSDDAVAVHSYRRAGMGWRGELRPRVRSDTARPCALLRAGNWSNLARWATGTGFERERRNGESDDCGGGRIVYRRHSGNHRTDDARRARSNSRTGRLGHCDQ